jgi:general secretion pathway protein I
VSSQKLEVRSKKSEVRTPIASGFTLLEVMVAVAIMAMVLVTLLGLRNNSIQDVGRAERITTATMLAKRKMVDATLNGKPRLPAEDEGTFTEDEFADYTWKKTIIPTPFTQLMEVRVAVLWMDGSRQEQVELLSYE